MKSQITNHKSQKIMLFVLIIGIWGLGFGQKAKADQLSLGTFPPIIQIQAKPPASISNPIAIQNFQDTPVSLNIEFKEFKPSNKNNGDIEFVNGPLPSIFQGMQVTDQGHVITQVDLAPKQRKTLTFHVGINSNEKPQDYYFSILFISTTPNLVSSTQSEAAGGIATNVLLSVGPTGPTQGEISEFSTPFFVEKGPVPFRVVVQNTSSHYITPNGIITIKNVFGQTVGNINLLPVNVLSNNSRIIPDQQASLDNPTAWWNEKFLLGPYTAKVILELSDQGPIYNKTVTFFAFPLELLAGILFSICIVVLIIKKVRDKQLQQALK